MELILNFLLAHMDILLSMSSVAILFLYWQEQHLVPSEAE